MLAGYLRNSHGGFLWYSLHHQWRPVWVLQQEPCLNKIAHYSYFNCYLSGNHVYSGSYSCVTALGIMGNHYTTIWHVDCHSRLHLITLGDLNQPWCIVATSVAPATPSKKPVKWIQATLFTSGGDYSGRFLNCFLPEVLRFNVGGSEMYWAKGW